MRSKGKSYLIIGAIRALSDTLFYITLVLFLIDTLDALNLGIVWGVHFGTLAILDYPTGVLGDVIGYKQVLLLAYIFKIGSILFLILSQTYASILVFMILYAVGLSQESGALEAWFDNSYKSLGVDEDRKNYTAFIARLFVFVNIFSVVGFVSGGIITTFFSVDILFYSYFVSLIATFLVVLFAMRGVESATQSNYYQQMIRTLRLFFSNKAIFFYIVGTAVLWTANESIWHTFISVRLYRDYSGSVAGAGLIRSILYVSIVFYQVLVVRFIKRFSATNSWILISSILSNAFFFFTAMLYFIFFPPSTYNIWLIIGFISLYQVPMFLESIEGVLRSRVTIDMIPDEYRNSMYSLLPSIVRLFGAIFVFIAGAIVAQTELLGSFVWLIAVSLVGSMLLGVGLYHNAKSTRQ